MLLKILSVIKSKFIKAKKNQYGFTDVQLNETKVFGEVSIGAKTIVSNSSLCGKINIAKANEITETDIQGSLTTAENCYIHKCSLNGNITTQKNCKLHKCEINGNVSIGRNTSLWGPNLDIYTNENCVEIGSYCSIARNVSFQTYNHNAKKITSYFIGANFFKENWENEQTSKGKTVVGNDVWIGTHCVILGGVTIGNGAMIAANSVVSKNVPAYAIVAGSPATIIGYRFDEKIIDTLEKIQWWNWNDETLHKNKYLFENEISAELLKTVAND